MEGDLGRNDLRPCRPPISQERLKESAPGLSSERSRDATSGGARALRDSATLRSARRQMTTCNRSRSAAIDHRLFQEARDRESAAERRASARAFVRQKTNRALSRVRTRRFRNRNWRRCANSSGGAARANRSSICSARSNSAGHVFLCDKRALVPRPETEATGRADHCRIANLAGIRANCSMSAPAAE